MNYRILLCFAVLLAACLGLKARCNDLGREVDAHEEHIASLWAKVEEMCPVPVLNAPEPPLADDGPQPTPVDQ